MLVLDGLIGLLRTVQLQLLQHYWSGHRLGLPWYWMVCLGNEQRSFCNFWDCMQVLHFRPFCHYRSFGLFCQHSSVLSRVLCAIHSLWFSCAFPSWIVMFNIFPASICPFILIGGLSRWFSLVTYNWVVFFCWWSVRVLYIFWILNIFSHSVAFSIFFIVSSNTQKLFILVKSKLSILGLIACALGILSKTPLPNVCGLCFYGPHL